MSIQVTVVHSPGPRQVQEIVLRMAKNSTVLHALQASGFFALFPSIDPQNTVVGIWGRKSSLQQTLRDNDRVEIYRALGIDPKAARRERFTRQGARTAGLFSKKRTGAKAGY